MGKVSTCNAAFSHGAPVLVGPLPCTALNEYYVMPSSEGDNKISPNANTEDYQTNNMGALKLEENLTVYFQSQNIAYMLHE